MKHFTDNDVQPHGAVAGAGNIICNYTELVYSPPGWMKRGLQETSSGYGKRLNSGYWIRFNGRMYRIYTTVCSNNGSCWFKTKGKTIFISAC